MADTEGDPDDMVPLTIRVRRRERAAAQARAKAAGGPTLTEKLRDAVVRYGEGKPMHTGGVVRNVPVVGEVGPERDVTPLPK